MGGFCGKFFRRQSCWIYEPSFPVYGGVPWGTFGRGIRKFYHGRLFVKKWDFFQAHHIPTGKIKCLYPIG